MSKKKFKNNKLGLSNYEKEMVQMLNHPEYTLDYLEEWVKNPPKDVYDDAVIALYEGRVEGYLAAVRQLKQSAIPRMMCDSYERNCYCEDVKMTIQDNRDHLSEQYPEVSFDKLLKDEDFLQKVANKFEDGLSENDGYWDAYWATMAEPIKDVLNMRSLRAS